MVDEGLVSKVQDFVCSLNGQDLKHVNDARAALFKTGKHLDDTLPPNKDSLEKQLLRANIQAPLPNSHRWTIDDGVLQVKLLDLLSAQNPVLERSNCKCKKNKGQT